MGYLHSDSVGGLGPQCPDAREDHHCVEDHEAEVEAGGSVRPGHQPPVGDDPPNRLLPDHDVGEDAVLVGSASGNQQHCSQHDEIEAEHAHPVDRELEEHGAGDQFDSRSGDVAQACLDHGAVDPRQQP
jgi:hypothetical protein